MRRMIFRALAVAAAATSVLAAPASSRAATLAPTPYMGWNPYYGLGGKFNEAVIKSVASSLISTGLAQAGYKIVWLDFGWASGARDSSGQLVVDSTQWPDGMKGLTDWLHQQGLEAGIYTDAGTSGCYGQGVGSYGHYRQDANTFAAWGFDAVKVDFCGAGQQIAAGKISATPPQLYAEFSEALSNNSSHRPMILNVCNFWTPGKVNGTDPSVANSAYGSYVWAPQIGQSWRTDTDIGFGGGKGIAFSDVLRNMDQDATHPEAAGPGHWNDPDYLGPGLGMTPNQAQSQFSMWAMLAAPLILGSDPRALSQAEITMLTNSNVIAVDQDPLGAQGTLVSQSGSGQVWAKPLANGDVAVALFNRGTTSTTIATTATDVGLPQSSGYSIQDVWANTPWAANPAPPPTSAGPISATVPAQTVALFRITPDAPTDNTSALRVAMAGADSGTLSANPGPISCPGTCSARYPAGSPVTLSATPTGGAAFVGWNGGGCSGTGSCSPTSTTGSTTSVSANFAFPLHTLTVSLDGSGSVADASGLISCPGACSAQYWPVTSVSLVATPAPGLVFAGWSGPCSGTGTCTVPLGDDAGVTARFAVPHKLTVSAIGAGSGTITGPGISCPGRCSASYPAGTSVTLTAAPAAGSGFGAWLSGGCPAGSTTCAVTLSADTNVTVAFDRPRSGTAYVVDAGRNDVVPIDLATDTSEAPIRGFDGPRQIATSPDGGTAYVVNAGSDTVTPVDLATNTTEPAIRGFQRPGPIAIAPDGKTAYVLEDGRRLAPIDLTTDQREPALTFGNRSGVGAHAASIAFARNGKTAYIGTFSQRNGRRTGTVAAVELSSGAVKATIRGFVWPAAIAIAANGRTAYVADRARGSVTAINLTTNRVLATSALSARGAFPGAGAAVVTPDGKTIYIADARPGVTAIDVATNRQKPTAGLTVTGPRALAVTPSGGTAYVTSGTSVIPIDLATETERPAVPGFIYPSAIAITNPPPANDSVRLARRLKRTPSSVTDALTCLASASSCTTTEMLSVIETHAGRSALVVGRRTVTIAARHTVKVTVRLDSAGQRLRRRLAGLPVILSVAIRRGHHLDTVATRRLVIQE